MEMKSRYEEVRELYMRGVAEEGNFFTRNGNLFWGYVDGRVLEWDEAMQAWKQGENAGKELVR